jgi:hypothetical protein
VVWCRCTVKSSVISSNINVVFSSIFFIYLQKAISGLPVTF